MIELNYRKDNRSDRIVTLPVSKSVMNRELILLALSGAELPTRDTELPDDVNILIRSLQSKERTIDLGAAGTAMRFCAAFFAVGDKEVILTGTERMKIRPIKDLVDALIELGADITYSGEPGYPPIAIRPTARIGGKTSISGAISSQFISALLLIGHKMEDGLELDLRPPINSRPYIDLTLSIIEKWGIQFQERGNAITIPHQEVITPISLAMERDWSAAAFFYGLVALGCPHELLLTGLSLDSAQGDRHLAELFEQLGVSSEQRDSGVYIHRSGPCVPEFKANLRHHPDLAQAFVFTCAALGIPCRLEGLQSLKLKETDRIHALAESLGICGIESEYDAECLEFKGTVSTASDLLFESYDDHRMAMSLSILATRYPRISILDQDVVKKSFPDFWNQLKHIGYNVRTAT